MKVTFALASSTVSVSPKQWKLMLSLDTSTDGLHRYAKFLLRAVRRGLLALDKLHDKSWRTACQKIFNLYEAFRVQKLPDFTETTALSVVDSNIALDIDHLEHAVKSFPVPVLSTFLAHDVIPPFTIIREAIIADRKKSVPLLVNSKLPIKFDKEIATLAGSNFLVYSLLSAKKPVDESLLLMAAADGPSTLASNLVKTGQNISNTVLQALFSDQKQAPLVFATLVSSVKFDEKTLVLLVSKAPSLLPQLLDHKLATDAVFEAALKVDGKLIEVLALRGYNVTKYAELALTQCKSARVYNDLVKHADFVGDKKLKVVLSTLASKIKLS